MGEAGVDSLIVAGQSNIRYLTGFTGDYGYAVIGSSEAVFFTSSLYEEQALLTVNPPFCVLSSRDIFNSFSRYDPALWGEVIGFDPEVVTYATFQKLEKSLTGKKLLSLPGLIESLRQTKAPSEIDAMSRAQAITEKVLGEVLVLIQEGVSECDLAAEIEYRFRKLSGNSAAFDTIVASGPNSSLPHAVPTTRKIRPGDLVLFDMGAVVEGYAADMTRTFVFGTADTKQKKLYSLVLEAHEAAIDRLTAGMKCSDAFRSAMAVFEKAGYGDRFIHSLGHGVGLDVHEKPSLSEKNHAELHTGFVVTVEPGLYLPDWGGIRIEDMLVITDQGCTNMTMFPKNLIEL